MDGLFTFVLLGSTLPGKSVAAGLGRTSLLYYNTTPDDAVPYS